MASNQPAVSQPSSAEIRLDSGTEPSSLPHTSGIEEELCQEDTCRYSMCLRVLCDNCAKASSLIETSG